MTITRGPFAPTVTLHVASTTTDAYGDEVATFADQQLPALAEFPGNALETVNPTVGDTNLVDRVLLVDASAGVSEYDEITASDGLRYRVNGAPALYHSPLTGTALAQVNLRRIT